MAKDPASTEPAKPKIVKIKRFQIGLNVILQVLILTIIVLFVNYLSFRHFKRWDFSRSQKFALSSQTTNLLKNLQKPVKAIIFFNAESPISGAVYQDVRGLLTEYEYASNKKLVVEVVDPYRNITRAKDLATQYKFGANESILILDYDGKNKFINAQDMIDMDMGNPMMGMQPEVKAFKGESVITSTLLELVEEKQKKIYLVAGHGEPEVGGKEIAAFTEYVKRQNIKMEPLKLGDVESIPEDATGLVVFGPRADYSELEIKRIGDFWEKKGRLFVMLNVEAKTPRINAWLSSVGVTPRGDRVLKTGTVLGQGEDGKIEILQPEELLGPRESIAPQPAPAVIAAPQRLGLADVAPLEPILPRPRRALVVDDSLVARIFLTRMLEQRGFPVVTAENSAELWAELGSKAFGVVFVDICLPDARGRAHLERVLDLRARSREPFAVVVLTRDHDDELVAEGAGARLMLRKPFESTALDQLLMKLPLQPEDLH